MTNGNGSVTGFINPRAERLTVGILSVVAIVGTAFYAGGEWKEVLRKTEAQQEQIDGNVAIIEQINTSLKTISDNLSAVRNQLRVSRKDPWRGDDMREWGDQVEELNDGLRTPDVDMLPGYKRRNAFESGRPATP